MCIFNLYLRRVFNCRILLSIKPTSNITRLPRSISTHFNYWKAFELRSWLFFYSVPLLHDIMHETYFVYYMAFVQAIHNLCSNTISHDILQHSETLWVYFVMSFDKLYEERYLTLNLYAVLHLPECVRNLGPLWAYFLFESANGDITSCFMGRKM